MNHKSIFTVTDEDLGRLDPTEAVLFFRELLWAEARRIGVEISKINVSTRTNVPDGGVDATVDEAQVETGCGIIKLGQTSYQIKSGDFKPWQESKIKDELFSKGNLGESIQACLHPDVDGTYVLVCTGIDLVASQQEDALNHIKKHLKCCGYPDAKVEVWGQDKLIGFLKLFPSLALWVNRNDRGNFQTHNSWSQDDDMAKEFVSGQEQDELIAKIQDELRRNDRAIHIRVLGEPGIGKTKLILEATRTSDLTPLVIYCTATQFQDSVLMNQLIRDDNQFAAVLVIDECNQEHRFHIWNKLKNRNPRVKLITVYNDYDEPTGDIAYFNAPPLEIEQIRNIIESYTIPTDVAERFSELCDGSPRVAHVVGLNLRNHPEDLLKPLDTVDVWGRYIVGGADPNSQDIKQRQRVLRHIALFKRFGFGKTVVDEAKAIGRKVEAVDRDITWPRFQEIIADLKKRRILQGEVTLYITPKLLHIKLWTEWWENYGEAFELEEFIKDLTPELVEWFNEMFRYAAESEAASRIVQELLGPDGPFGDGEYLKTEMGSRFFSALTEADPESALRCLERTIGTWNRETLLRFTEGRGNVIWALQKIAVWRELFAGAASLLLALGEAENATYSNNASGTFAELFSPGPGKVAPTGLPPLERVPILEEAFESDSKERHILALKACNVALQSTQFWRMGSIEYQGLHKEAELWEPKTDDEIHDAYCCVWKLLEEQLDRLPEDERTEGINILLERARGLGQSTDLIDMVVNTVATIAKKTTVNEKQVIERIGQILRYDGTDLPVEIRQRWEHLRDELVGSDFHSLMQRYVGMDLLEDRFDEDENYVDQAQPRIETLAQQVVDNHHLLQSELHWLVTVEAKKGYHFGYELGKRDDGFSLLPTLLDAQRNAGENVSVSFLGSYFHAIFEKDVLLWEEQLDALVNDTTLNVAIPDLTHRSSLTDRAGWRVLSLAENGIIGINHFGIFVYGKAVKSLSNKVFTAWIKLLLSVRDKTAVSTALHLYHDYYVFEKPEPTLPCALTFQLLTHLSLFEGSDERRLDTMTDFYWTEIGKSFLHCCPEESLELVELMLTHLGTKGTIVGGFKTQTISVLTEMMKQYPSEVWDRVSKYLEDRMHPRTIVLERWLREGNSSARKKEKGALTLIPPKKIWEWIDEEVEDRAPYCARRLVPKTLSTVEWRASLVREILVRYGTQEDFQRALMLNYLTEGWSGPASLHYENKQRMLLDIKDGEDNENVKRWIDEFVDGLEKAIESAKIEEERES